MTEQNRNVLISVSNKEGLVANAQWLVALGFNVIASGGTANYLDQHGVAVTPTTKFINRYAMDILRRHNITITPEIEEALAGAIFDHRIATISRDVDGGLLTKKKHLAELAKFMMTWIHMVIVDFYPFEKVIAEPSVTFEKAIDNIDVGGPHMAHSAAKGAAEGRIIICDLKDCDWVLKQMEKSPEHDLDQPTKEMLAAKADFVVGKYCTAVAIYRGGDQFDGMFGTKVAEGKGENGPQGPSIVYDQGTEDPLAHLKFRQIEGIPPGHVNRRDIDRLLQTITHAAAAFDLNLGSVPFFAFGVKHGNACGGAYGDNKVEVLQKMLEGDLQAIFGGFVMVNFEIDAECAEVLVHYKKPNDAKRRKLDGIVTPGFGAIAVDMLKSKTGSCRLFVNPALVKLDKDSLDKSSLRIPVRGGYLKQKNYGFVLDLRVANTELQKYGMLDGMKAADMLLAYAICTTSNSNTITIVKDGMLIGNGVGQQSRVKAGRLAVYNATDSGHDVSDSVACSDSFFPFPDGPELLIKAGVKTIFATSGSKNDQLTIDLCTREQVTLLMMPDSNARMFFGH